MNDTTTLSCVCGCSYEYDSNEVLFFVSVFSNFRQLETHVGNGCISLNDTHIKR